MKDSASALATAIGLRVRALRQERGWTLDRLAETAGVSRRMVVNIEQGAANPSVGTLLRLSDALGVGLPELVQSPRPASVRVTRAGEGALLWNGTSGGRGELVAATQVPEINELWDWTLGAGDRRVSEPHSPGTRELLQVREGSLTLTVAARQYLLAAGDAAAFPGDVAHSYANSGKEPARFCLAVFEPAVRSGRRRPADA